MFGMLSRTQPALLMSSSESEINNLQFIAINGAANYDSSHGLLDTCVRRRIVRRSVVRLIYPLNRCVLNTSTVFSIYPPPHAVYRTNVIFVNGDRGDTHNARVPTFENRSHCSQHCILWYNNTSKSIINNLHRLLGSMVNVTQSILAVILN